MKSLVIFPSVRCTDNFGKYAENFARFKYSPDVLVIDEDDTHRKAVKLQFAEQGITPGFFGKVERAEWFKHNTPDINADLLIPQRSHDELSFGLLVALKRDYDMIVFLDDDTYPAEQAVDFLGEHWRRLCGFSSEVKINRSGNWVNTHPYMHARGFPYCQRPGDMHFSGWKENVSSVLNMGLWQGIPDLNAIDYLMYDAESDAGFRQTDDFHLAVGEYAPICSMNVAFKPEIIPAFYQLWDNNRYNDIFSGVFLKRIADHLGKFISVGNPLCYHDKVPRDLFKDAAAELPSIKLNESLVRALSELELQGNRWLECYRELATGLNAKYRESEFSDTVWRMASKMLLWCDVVEKVMA